MNKTIVIVIVVVVLLGTLGAWYVMPRTSQTSPEAVSYKPVVSSSIQVDNPQSGQSISGNIVISGKAKGSWFFEAVFPIQLQDKNGKVLATAQAHALTDWMTADYVPFMSELQPPANFSGSAVLVFMKDNPSGLAKNDESVKVPVVIAK